jgi:hypothetical protein
MTNAESFSFDSSGAAFHGAVPLNYFGGVFWRASDWIFHFDLGTKASINS